MLELDPILASWSVPCQVPTSLMILLKIGQQAPFISSIPKFMRMLKNNYRHGMAYFISFFVVDNLPYIVHIITFTCVLFTYCELKIFENQEFPISLHIRLENQFSFFYS